MSVTTTSESQSVSSAALTDMRRKIDQLPLLPQVLLRILQVSSTQNDYFDQIVNLARQDPPFAVRLLAMANSANSSPVSPIKSIKESLTRIGANTITNFVACLAVQRVFVPSSPSQVALWRHSVRTAVMADTLAQLLPALKVDKNQIYLAGLLHDIGRFVMFEHAPAELLKVDESLWNSPEQLIEADVEVFKFTHSELGYLACVHWGLPDDLAQTVRRHHEELEGAVAPGSIEASILCIEIADRVDVMIMDNPDCAGLSPAEYAEQIDERCLWSEDVKKLVKTDALAMRIDKIKKQCDQLLGGLGLS